MRPEQRWADEYQEAVAADGNRSSRGLQSRRSPGSHEGETESRKRIRGMKPAESWIRAAVAAPVGGRLGMRIRPSFQASAALASDRSSRRKLLTG